MRSLHSFLKKSLWWIESESLTTLNPNITSDWIWSYIKKSGKITDWWQEILGSFTTQGAKPLNDTQVQFLASRQAAVLQAGHGPSRKVWLAGALCPAWVCWDEKSSSLCHSRAARTSQVTAAEWNGGAGPGSSMVCHTMQNAPKGCWAEQFRSSTDV